MSIPARIRRALVVAGATSAVAVGCARGHSSVDTFVSRARQATTAYRDLDSAVAAGYAGHVAQCIENQPEGAMGYHHVNRALLDDRLEVDRPEMLVYARDTSGAYKLNGIEYIVPYTARPRDAEPPTVMGQRLKRADGLRLWYLHVWIWEPNPNGLFADWNPSVRCP